MSLVSVIIPAYNAATLIAESINSILAQSWRRLEVLVIDDGSTDETATVVQRFFDPRVRLIRQSNQGQCAALNHGIAEAQGDFIKFVDADDWINPGHLAAQMASIHGTENCISCCSWGYFQKEPHLVVARDEHTGQNYKDPLEWLVDSLSKDEGMMGGPRWLIPRALLEKSGPWDERLSLNNDFDFSVRLLLASAGVRFAPQALYAYRKGVPGALSGSSSRSAMMSAFLTTESGCRNLLERENSPRIRQIAANRWQDWLFKFYPTHRDLALQAEAHVKRLGGSTLSLQGGTLLRLLLPLLGWKGVRQLQSVAFLCGWRAVVLRRKETARLLNLQRK